MAFLGSESNADEKTHMEIFNSSQRLAEEFQKRLSLEEFPELGDIQTHTWRDTAVSLLKKISPVTSAPSGQSSQDVIGNESTGHPAIQVPYRVQSAVSRESPLITFSLTTQSPRLAQRMLEVYLHVYFDLRQQHRRAELQEAVAWLKKELERAKKSLVESQVRLIAFTTENDIVDTRDGGMTQAMALVNKALESKLLSQERETTLKLLESHLKDGTVKNYHWAADQDMYVSGLKSDIARMESEYAQMRAVYSERYYKLTLLSQKIQFMKDKVKNLEQTFAVAAVVIAEQQSQAADERLQKAREEAARVQLLLPQYMILKEEVKSNSELQDRLFKEYRRMSLRAKKVNVGLKMVDPPSLPVTPSWPNPLLNFLIGSLLGLFAGVSAVFVSSAFDETVRHHTQIEKELGLRKLGVVPTVDMESHADAGDGQAPSIEFLAYTRPGSLLADAIRNVETAVRLSNIDDPIRSMAVSSTVPGEGKTLVAVSLSTVLTSAGRHKVVLVDADLRRPRVYKALGFHEKGPGLSDLLSDPGLSLDQVLRQHQIPGFFSITSGDIPEDPIRLLMSGHMGRVMQELETRFDYVVVDCPPILGFSDTPVISRYVDGTILMVRPGQVLKNQLKEAVNSVRRVDGARVLGFVMNMANGIHHHAQRHDAEGSTVVHRRNHSIPLYSGTMNIVKNLPKYVRRIIRRNTTT